MAPSFVIPLVQPLLVLELHIWLLSHSCWAQPIHSLGTSIVLCCVL